MKNQFFKKYKLIILVLLALVGYQIYQFVKKVKNNVGDNIKNSLAVIGVKKSMEENGISPTRAAAIITISENIYDALHGSWYDEDEAKANQNFQMLKSVVEAVSCASVYSAYYNRSLYGDIKKYMQFGQLDGMKESYLNAIKAM